jgi:hypothetical protein
MDLSAPISSPKKTHSIAIHALAPAYKYTSTAPSVEGGKRDAQLTIRRQDDEDA